MRLKSTIVAISIVVFIGVISLAFITINNTNKIKSINSTIQQHNNTIQNTVGMIVLSYEYMKNPYERVSFQLEKTFELMHDHTSNSQYVEDKIDLLHISLKKFKIVSKENQIKNNRIVIERLLGKIQLYSNQIIEETFNNINKLNNNIKNSNELTEKISWIIATITILLVLIFFVILINKIMRPLSVILEGTKKIEKDIGYQIDVNKDDFIDFQELILSFNQTNTKLKEYTTNLQEMVYQRTEELEETNEELQVSINNLNQTQKYIIETEKMASLGSLVAGISHEINTPIGLGITSTTHFVSQTKKLKKLYDDNNMTEKDFEKYIKDSDQLASITYENLKRAADLVKSFKQLSVDQTSEEKRKFYMKKYIEETLLTLHNKIKQTKINIELKCNNEINIYSFPGAYSQIITNLIMNSLIHGYNQEEDGIININIKVENNNLIFVYKDDGKGIKKEYIEKIFDPFFTTNRAHGGSGLGMNIIYNIVTQQLNGKIKCTNNIDKGVEFIMNIPIEIKKEMDWYE